MPLHALFVDIDRLLQTHTHNPLETRVKHCDIAKTNTQWATMKALLAGERHSQAT